MSIIGGFTFFLYYCVFSFSIASCGEYDGVHASQCTQGFPTPFHIDQVVKNTDLDTLSAQQVLIPSINFTCNGTITRWVIGARWQGQLPAYTELQIWRKISDNTYIKVAGTSIIVGTSNNSEVYEYPLQNTLDFQEGDIIGYFQPIRNRSELDLYLEDSGRINTYHQNLGINNLNPPNTGDIFSLESALRDTRYPLIAAHTGI